MKNTIKEILISQMSFPLKYKNEKEIWWEDERGKPITIEIIDVENEQCVVKRYYDNGQLCVKRNYHQGRLHGEFLWLYENGQPWIKKNYRQGRLHGEYFTWYKNGELSYKLKYNHGELINPKHY